MVCLAPYSRGGQVKEFSESFHVVVERTGGVALLAVLPCMVLGVAYKGLQAAGRSFWSSGTRNRKLAREILDAPRHPDDELYRSIAESYLKYEKL